MPDFSLNRVRILKAGLAGMTVGKMRRPMEIKLTKEKPQDAGKEIRLKPAERGNANAVLTEENRKADRAIQLQSMVKKNGFTISEPALDFAYEVLEKKYNTRTEDFANAREVRNLFESAIVSQADRLYGKEKSFRGPEKRLVLR